MKRFDPYEILEIGRDAELKEIKKAYRYKTYFLTNYYIFSLKKHFFQKKFNENLSS